MKLRRTRRSRKLNNQFRHVYKNMMAGQKGASTGPWASTYNRMLKDLLLDLQDSSAFPSNGYLHEQMHQLKSQAMRISAKSNEKGIHSLNWDAILSAVLDADLFWENQVHQKTGELVLRAFALINDQGLNSSEVSAIQSALGGTHLEDQNVIHVKCISYLRMEPLSEEDEGRYERPVKRLLIDLMRDEMSAAGGESEIGMDARSFREKIEDRYLMWKL